MTKPLPHVDRRTYFTPPLNELPDLPGALCKGIDRAEVFFPRTTDMDYRFAVAQARSLCALCPEREACLSWALANHVDGIWAGTTYGERRRLLKQKKAEAGRNVVA